MTPTILGLLGFLAEPLNWQTLTLLWRSHA